MNKQKCNKRILKNLIVSGRSKKRISQRELARRIGINHISVNDLEEGRIQKPSIEILTNISKELDISISKLLKAAGYGQLLFLLNNDELKITNEKEKI